MGWAMILERWMVEGAGAVAARRDEDRNLRVLNTTQRADVARCVEVAGHGAKRRKGLLGCSGLAAGHGLWIVPCEAVHTFGMRFAIDLVYLDRKMRVKKVRSNVRPWRLSACLSAHSVLELAPGTVVKTGVRAGDVLEFLEADAAESLK
jgi:uncharacterized membrane protein (UPF0127 family)